MRPGDLVWTGTRFFPEVWSDVEEWSHYGRKLVRMKAHSEIARSADGGYHNGDMTALIIAIHPLASVEPRSQAILLMIENGDVGWSWNHSWKRVMT